MNENKLWAVFWMSFAVVLIVSIVTESYNARIRAEACKHVQGRLDRQGNCVK